MKLEFSFSCKVGGPDATLVSALPVIAAQGSSLSLVPPVVEVLEPPFNSPLQERVANQRIAFPCPAKGKMADSLHAVPHPRGFTLSPASFRSA